MAKLALEVYLHDSLAGALLRKDNGNLQFRYDRAYLAADGLPLSVNLPLRVEAYPHRDCLAFFGNLLPEANVREQVALATGISVANDYKLLERFGGDVAGAVTLLPLEPVRRLHQEDFCQALGKLHVEKYQHEGGPGVREAMALIDEVSMAPARDRQQLWLALVFNFLIGNCDAHGKNYSLLYDSRAPSLAPFYDLLSTTVYGELTTRLAMSIDGATHLEDVGMSAWAKLAKEVGFASRFLAQRMLPLVQRVRDAATELSKQDEHAGAPVATIVAGIGERAGLIDQASG